MAVSTEVQPAVICADVNRASCERNGLPCAPTCKAGSDGTTKASREFLRLWPYTQTCNDGGEEKGRHEALEVEVGADLS